MALIASECQRLAASNIQISGYGDPPRGARSRIVSWLFGLVGGALGYLVGGISLVALGVASKLLFFASIVLVLFGGFAFMIAGAFGWKHDTLMEAFHLLGAGIACGIIRDICIRLFRKIAGYSHE